MKHVAAALLALAPLAAAIDAPAFDLVADVNRDGVLDARDADGEDAWTWERGAVFLNNSDSDQNTGEPDHADAVLNGAADLDDLAELRLAREATLDSAATVTVAVDAASASRVRVFLRTSNGTTASILPGAGTIAASLLRDGDVELRIEANTFALPTWNGQTVVTVTASEPGGRVLSDSVRLRVAPWLLLSNAQPGTAVYLREYPTQNDVMKAQLQGALPSLGATLVTSPGGTTPYPQNNIWMQDAMEIGYTELPGHAMNVVLKSNRGPSWPLSNFPKDTLLSADYGWFSVGSYRAAQAGGSEPDGWLDWFGNLEVTPPLPGYPHGRVYYGRNPATAQALDPAIVGMIDAQELQGPALALDTGWLLIQHVDEMICWVPTSVPNQFKILVPDTRAMYALLDQWVTAGYGAQPMLRVYNSTETVAAFRNDTSFRNANISLQTSRIDPMIEAAKTAWGLTEDDVIRVPSAYYSNGGCYVPSMINALVLNCALFASDPHGPEPAGTDLMQQDFIQRLANAGVTLDVHFLDDQRYHKWSGNVHCATNTRRTPFSPGIWEAATVPSAADGWTLY